MITMFQGIWNFLTFEDYKRDWIIPAVIGDLKTTFRGTRELWEDEGPSLGREYGAGNFVLAGALFAAFDQLGCFLAPTPNVSRSAAPNIRRVCRLLPSTQKVDAVLGLHGRNTLIHQGWPKTLTVMDGGTWGFGLNFASKSEQSDNGKLYRSDYPFPDPGSPPLPTLKLRLNVHVLLAELEAEVKTGSSFSSVNSDVFDQIRHSAIQTCQTGRHTNTARDLDPGLERLESAAARQIRELRQEAIRRGVW